MLRDEILRAIRTIEDRNGKTYANKIAALTSENVMPVIKELRKMYKEEILDTTDNDEYFIRKGVLAHCDCPGDCNH